jgi:hypothetical protein
LKQPLICNRYDVDLGVAEIFGQAFLKRVVPKPLRRFITPIGFGDKILKSKSCQGFSLKSFLKRLAIKLFFKRFAKNLRTQINY